MLKLVVFEFLRDALRAETFSFIMIIIMIVVT